MKSTITLSPFVLAALIAFTLIDCGKGDRSQSAAKEYTVGLLMETYDLDRWQRDERLFTETANRLGASVLRAVADGDQDRQNKQADALLTQGVDVLVVVPKNLNTAARIVKSAHEKNVPVIAYDRLILNCNLDFYVTFDNERVGYMEARGVVDKVAEGNYILLGGAASDNNAKLLRDGQLRAIREHEERTGKRIEILADPFLDNWDREEARRRVSNLLTKFHAMGKKVDAIVASNDATAGGAIAALMSEQLEGKVAVSGQDAELAACQRIVEGTQTLTVYKPVSLLAATSAEVAVRLAKGERPDTIIAALGFPRRAVDNGSAQVPSVFLEPVFVTKESIDSTVIKDGWQTREKVYSNLRVSR